MRCLQHHAGHVHEERDPVNRRWRGVAAERARVPEHTRYELALVTCAVLITFVVVGVLLQFS
jgi:hypothetical protein